MRVWTARANGAATVRCAATAWIGSAPTSTTAPTASAAMALTANRAARASTVLPFAPSAWRSAMIALIFARGA